MKSLPKDVQEIQGVEGMILLEYVGKSMGTQSWYGPVTGKPYSFGLTKNKIQPVDPKDLQTNSPHKPGFLEIREGGQKIFKVVKNQPKKAATLPVAEKKLTTIPKAEVTPSVAEERAFERAFEDGAGIAKKAMENLPKESLDISVAAKELADEMGITQADIEIYITGTGIDDKITVKDIRKYGSA
jgi:pyruvate/2-oxoglutarate dehydrogenase complex dihydrolipoamide acyltransferase (E2) component